jgi:ribosomal protein L16 Arg81 hydroxylase
VGAEVFDFARLIAPVEPALFRSKYWERRPLIVVRDQPLYYRDLMSLAEMDATCSLSNFRSTDFRLMRNGHETSISRIVDQSDMLTLERVYSEYRNGSTLILMFLHERVPALWALCRALAQEFSAAFQVNAYLTPRNAQGLSAHYDTHDVFVLQIHGEKQWRLYEAAEILPVPTLPYRREELSSRTPTEEVTLKAGDLLYIPRGIVHEASSKDRTSLHLTVGILSITWGEVIISAIESVVRKDWRLRESLPLGFSRNEALCRDAEHRLAELLDLIKEKISVQDIIKGEARRAGLFSRPDLRGHLLDLDMEPAISLMSLLWRRRDLQWEIQIEDDECKLVFNGKELRMPGHLAESLQHIANAEGPITGASVPGNLDEAGKLVLVQRLLREGFLRGGPPSNEESGRKAGDRRNGAQRT